MDKPLIFSGFFIGFRTEFPTVFLYADTYILGTKPAFRMRFVLMRKGRHAKALEKARAKLRERRPLPTSVVHSTEALDSQKVAKILARIWGPELRRRMQEARDSQKCIESQVTK